MRPAKPASVDHFDIVVSDLAASLEFYRGLLAPLGWTEVTTIEGERGEPVHYLGGETDRPISLSLREAQSPGGTPYDRYAVGIHHIAFAATSRASVDERHRWLIEHGAEIESEPREYDYTEGYYAVFFYDPDGIKLEVLHVPG